MLAIRIGESRESQLDATEAKEGRVSVIMVESCQINCES